MPYMYTGLSKLPCKPCSLDAVIITTGDNYIMVAMRHNYIKGNEIGRGVIDIESVLTGYRQYGRSVAFRFLVR